MAKLLRLVSLTFLLVLLASCGWNPLSFWQSNKDEANPADLVNFDEEVRLRRQWSVNIGKGQGKTYNRIKPAIDGDIIYAASSNGNVYAINRE